MKNEGNQKPSKVVSELEFLESFILVQNHFWEGEFDPLDSSFDR